MEENNYKDELKRMAPHLSLLHKKDAFPAPQNYFEKLSVRISDRVHAEKSQSRWENFASFILSPRLAVPCLLLVIAGGYFYTQESTYPHSVSEITSTSVSNLSDEELLSQLDESTLTDAVYTETDQVTGDEMDYLLNNHTDLNTIINEL